MDFLPISSSTWMNDRERDRIRNSAEGNGTATSFVIAKIMIMIKYISSYSKLRRFCCIEAGE